MTGKKLITIFGLLVLIVLSTGQLFAEVSDHLISVGEPIYPHDYRIGALHPLHDTDTPKNRAAMRVNQFFADIISAGKELTSPAEMEVDDFRSYLTEESFYMQEKMVELIREKRNIFPQYVRIGRGNREQSSRGKVLINFPVKLASYYRGKLYIRTGTILLEDEKISGADFSLFAPFPQDSASLIEFEADTTDRSYHGQYTW